MSVVYFIDCASSPLIKIGVAADLYSRFFQLQTGNPHPLNLVAEFPGNREAEAAVHSCLAHYRARLEWYGRDATLLFIEDAKAIGLMEAAGLWQASFDNYCAKRRAFIACSTKEALEFVHDAADWFIGEHGLKEAAGLIQTKPARLANHTMSASSALVMTQFLPPEMSRRIWADLYAGAAAVPTWPLARKVPAS